MDVFTPSTVDQSISIGGGLCLQPRTLIYTAPDATVGINGGSNTLEHFRSSVGFLKPTGWFFTIYTTFRFEPVYYFIRRFLQWCGTCRAYDELLSIGSS